MGFYSELDLDILDMIKDGANFNQIKAAYPMLRDDEINQYLEGQNDGEDSDGQWSMSDSDDGQPTEYQEWQDYMGGDDWDQGQFEESF